MEGILNRGDQEIQASRRGIRFEQRLEGGKHVRPVDLREEHPGQKVWLHKAWDGNSCSLLQEPQGGYIVDGGNELS